MRESALYTAVNRRLPSSIHTQSMTGSSMVMNGTFDRYYDGSKRDLWIEWKVWPSIPRSGTINVAPLPDRKKQPQGRLSHQQMRWGVRRWNTGQNAVVAVGLTNRRVLLLKSPDGWCADVSILDAITIDEVAKWIINFTGVSDAHS